MAQLFKSAINLVDTVIMGLMRAKTLAAGALGGITFLSIVLTGCGTTEPVGAMTAEVFGA